MALSKIDVVDRIEIVESGVVQVRTATRIVEDNETIINTFHRHTVAPGDDYSQQDTKVQAICAAVHTTDVVTAYKVAQLAQSKV
jgi:hypothetical protein